MNRSLSRFIVPTLVAVAVMGGCSGASRAPMQTAAASPASGQVFLSPAERAKADSGRPPYTAADVYFMSGMIGHHAQAVLMAGWAPSHGASQSVRILCERIVVGQRDEITFMQRWLRDRRETVPDADATHDMMPGMDHSKLMPGMLTADELTALDRARGTEFDRLFLGYMIKHHQGALTMVDQLFGSNGAGQDDAIFKFASDVSADQSTEIERMGLMLSALPTDRKTP
ncbi:MAG: DUF305 domain-containing protein [Gemmatimonadaceae bacterium]